ncbi:hypothetical protein AtNW77_Chr3g0218911 [Arabidopsis thaliana]
MGLEKYRCKMYEGGASFVWGGGCRGIIIKPKLAAEREDSINLHIDCSILSIYSANLAIHIHSFIIRIMASAIAAKVSCS